MMEMEDKTYNTALTSPVKTHCRRKHGRVCAENLVKTISYIECFKVCFVPRRLGYTIVKRKKKDLLKKPKRKYHTIINVSL